jgi:tetratricopeptide (TPR) repeat protein
MPTPQLDFTSKSKVDARNSVQSIDSRLILHIVFNSLFSPPPLCDRMAMEVDPIPNPVSFSGIGTALEASGGNKRDLDHLKEAVKAYRKALEYSNKSSTKFYMAVALERLGQTEESEPILESMQRSEAPASCLVDSWGYVR